MDVRTIKSGSGETTVLNTDEGRKRYATKGEALGIGIPALALGGLAFLRQGGFGGLFGGGCNEGVAVANEITAKEAYTKECEDAVALTAAIYQGRITDLQEKFAIRQNDVDEKFQIYKSQVDGDFGLYKSGRDADDVLANRISRLECKVDVNSATLAEREKAREREKELEYALINCKIENTAKQSAFDLAWRTCRMIEGRIVLPNDTAVTGLPSQGCCPNLIAQTV